MLQYHSDGTAGPIWLPYELDPSQIRDNGGTLFTKLSYLDAGATSWFRMDAIYEGGGSSDWGYASATANARASVGSTSIQATVVSDTEIDLSWTVPPGNYTDIPYYDWNAFLLMGRVTGADGSGINSEPPSSEMSQDMETGACTAHLIDLMPGTHYYFMAGAAKVYGDMPSGDIVYGQADATTSGTKDETVPVAPGAISAVIDPQNERQVDIHWKNSSDNETGFLLERSVNGVAFTTLTELGADQTAYIDNSIPFDDYGNAKVQYRVSAIGSVATSQPATSGQINLVQEYIALLEGDNAKGLRGVIADELHESVAAGHYSGSKFVIDAAFSFGQTGWDWYWFKTTWLGWHSETLAGYLMTGTIQSTNFYTSVISTKKVSLKQESAWVAWMKSKRDGKSDVYSVLRHNCREYAQWEYADAPGKH